MARRFRREGGRGRGARKARPQARRSLADAPRALRSSSGPTRRPTRAARSRRPTAVGARPPLVARPDGADERAADRADGADLALLVRDLEPGRRLAAADAQPDRVLPRERARLVRRPPHGRHEGPGDADLAERQPEHEGQAERELRPGDDGAVHARRRPRRLHRDRRTRAGAGADRLDRRRQRGLPRSPSTDSARHRLEDDLRPHRQLHLAGLVQPLPRPPAAPVVLRDEALELLRPDRARHGDRRRAREIYEGTADPPVVEAILKHPDLYNGPRMVKPPVVLQRRLLRMAGAGSTPRRGGARRRGGSSSSTRRTSAGWDYTRWLDTATWRARWFIAALVQGRRADRAPRDPAELVRPRSAFWGSPTIALEDADPAAAFAGAQLKRNARRATSRPPCAGSSPPPPTSRPHDTGCHDCNRTETWRRAVAEAGRGLPGIEPGMPVPAGNGPDPP